MRHALALAACLVAAGCGGASPPQGPGAAAERPAVVARVVDGDTLLADVGGVRERVRLLGVDAPESVTPERPVECFGPQAAARARELMPEGAVIILTSDPSQGARDRFDRLLAEVTIPGGGATVNERLVEGGYAEVFRGDGRGRLQPALRAAERRARDALRGLWAACRPG